MIKARQMSPDQAREWLVSVIEQFQCYGGVVEIPPPKLTPPDSPPTPPIPE
jgi:hypothetical protein